MWFKTDFDVVKITAMNRSLPNLYLELTVFRRDCFRTSGRLYFNVMCVKEGKEGYK